MPESTEQGAGPGSWALAVPTSIPLGTAEGRQEEAGSPHTPPCSNHTSRLQGHLLPEERVFCSSSPVNKHLGAPRETENLARKPTARQILKQFGFFFFFQVHLPASLIQGSFNSIWLLFGLVYKMRKFSSVPLKKACIPAKMYQESCKKRSHHVPGPRGLCNREILTKRYSPTPRMLFQGTCHFRRFSCSIHILITSATGLFRCIYKYILPHPFICTCHSMFLQNAVRTSPHHKDL